MLEHPKAKYATTQPEMVNVNAAKAEKNIWISQAEIKSPLYTGVLKDCIMDNQQGNYCKVVPQRLPYSTLV